SPEAKRLGAPDALLAEGSDVTTLHVGSLALRPAGWRRPPRAFVGRLRDGRLPHRPASLATRLNRQLPGLDSHQQATGPPRRTCHASGSPRAHLSGTLW